MAKVVPFPRWRDRRYVCRHGYAFATAARDQTAEKLLAHQLRIQRDKWTRIGVDPLKVEDNVRQLEVAIRCEAGRLMSEGDVA